MACEDDDLVAAVLEPDGGVDDESFRASDAQVRVEEDNCLLCRLFRRPSERRHVRNKNKATLYIRCKVRCPSVYVPRHKDSFISYRVIAYRYLP